MLFVVLCNVATKCKVEDVNAQSVLGVYCVLYAVCHRCIGESGCVVTRCLDGINLDIIAEPQLVYHHCHYAGHCSAVAVGGFVNDVGNLICGGVFDTCNTASNKGIVALLFSVHLVEGVCLLENFVGKVDTCVDDTDDNGIVFVCTLNPL